MALLVTVGDTITYVNPAAVELFGGTSREQITGRTPYEFLLPKWHDTVRAGRAGILRGEAVAGAEAELRRLDGEVITVILTGWLYPVESGTGIIASCTDITAMKGAQRALHEAESRFQAFMERVPAVAYMKDEEGRMVYANPEFLRQFGLTEQECLGREICERLGGRLAEALRENDRTVLQDNQPHEFLELFPTAGGELRPWWSIRFPCEAQDGSRYVGGMSFDMTERKRQEAARTHQNWLLQMIARGTDVTDVLMGVCRALEEQVTGSWSTVFGLHSPRTQDGLRWAVGPSLPRTLLGQLRQLHGPGRPNPCPDAIGQGREVQVTDLRHAPEYADGERRRLLSHGIEAHWSWPVWSRKGAVLGSVNLFFRTPRQLTDSERTAVEMLVPITGLAMEYARVREELRSSEERRGLALEAVNLGTWQLNLETKQLSWDARTSALFDTAQSGPVPYEDALRRLLPEDVERTLHIVRQSIESGGEMVNEFRIQRKDGTIRWLSARGRMARNEEGLPVRMHGILADITEQKTAERAFEQLSGRLLEIQDGERRRVARELHDTTGQSLAAAAMSLARVQTEGVQLSPAARQALADAAALVEQSLSEIRMQSYLLHPPLLDELGLASALRWYVDGFERCSGIRTALTVDSRLGRLTPELELTLFRIVQESLANVHRHSGSAVARVNIQRENGWVSATVKDQGTGMPITVEQGAPPGVGIAGMRERVRQVDGQLSISSSADGTTVHAFLPTGLTAVPVEQGDTDEAGT